MRRPGASIPLPGFSVAYRIAAGQPALDAGHHLRAVLRHDVIRRCPRVKPVWRPGGCRHPPALWTPGNWLSHSGRCSEIPRPRCRAHRPRSPARSEEWNNPSRLFPDVPWPWCARSGCMTGLSERERQRHGETRRMRRAEKFFGIGAPTAVAHARLETVGSLEQAAAKRYLASAVGNTSFHCACAVRLIIAFSSSVETIASAASGTHESGDRG